MSKYLVLVLLIVCVGVQGWSALDKIAADAGGRVIGNGNNLLKVGHGKKVFLGAIPKVDEVPETPQQEPTCDLFTSSCTNNEITLCGHDGKTIKVPCKFGGNPGFCDCEGTACVKEQPYSCPGKAVERDCYQIKTKLPIFSNCSRFSFCMNDHKLKIMECASPGFVYNPVTMVCSAKTIQNPCNILACPQGTSYAYVPYPQAPEYYLFCINGQGDVRKCPLGYFATNSGCEFKCNAEGYFPDLNLSSCAKGYYYTCVRSGTQIVKTHAKCDEGQLFDKDAGMCLPGGTCNSI